jgi:hypothetical protein
MSDEDEKITPSCGCIFCDLELERFLTPQGLYCHAGPNGKLYICTLEEDHED